MQIVSALHFGAQGVYEPQLAYKHWKPENFVSATDLSVSEIRSFFDLPINATALGYYVNDKAALAQEPASFQTYIQTVKQFAPSDKPLMDWETGASTYNLTESEQVKWALDMMQVAEEEGLLGFNWWQWIDWAPRASGYSF